MIEREWKLPGEPDLGDGLHLDLDQLLLLDWMLTPCSNIYPQASLDEAMKWQAFRLGLLDCIAIWERVALMADGSLGKPSPIPALAVSQSEANVLLAVCPTEFRWGPGINCGLSLKLKLRAYLRGEKEEDSASSPATSTTQTDG